MKAIRRLTVTCGAALVAATASGQPVETPRLGILVSGNATQSHGPIAAFREGLQDLRYVEGRTIRTEYRYSEGSPRRLTELAKDLMRLEPSLLVALGGNDIARALASVAGNTPIVMAGGSDPVGAGLVASLARPGGNVTGLTSLSAELTGKRLELIKELVPGIRAIAALYSPNSRQKKAEAAQLRGVAESLGIEVLMAEVRTVDDIERSISAAVAHGIGAMSVLSDTFTRVHGKSIVTHAIARRLPTMFADRRRMRDAGGLISYGPDYADMWRRAAVFVDKILRGAKPSDLPVERPAKFELVVDLRAAKDLGIAVPQSILLRADEVIE